MKKIIIVLFFCRSIILAGQTNNSVQNESKEPPPPSMADNKEKSTPKKVLKYVDSGSFSEGLAAIMTGAGKWGFIDKQGNLVILPQYDKNLAIGFRNGVGAVYSNRKLSMIDKLGKNIIPEGYTIDSPQGNNFITVTKDGMLGLIDYSGKLIIPFGIYSRIWYVEPLHLFKVEQNHKRGYLDIDGKVVLAPKYTDLDFENFGDPIKAVKGEKYGFIDLEGNERVPLKYDRVKFFSDGFASVRLNNKYGFINKKGEEIILLKYEDACDFSGGLAGVKLQDKWGVIDAADQLVIPAVYQEIFKFYKGLAVVKQNEKYGVIDRKGKIIIPIEYEFIQECSEELIGKDKDEKTCFAVEKNGKKGILDYNGKAITPAVYNEVFNLSNQRTILVLNKKYGLINRATGKLLVDFKYDFIYPSISENSTYVTNAHKAGFIDFDGNEIIPLVYDAAKNFSEGLAAVIMNGEVSFIDKKNKIVLKPIVPKALE